jgi:hypothetical protein
MATKANLNIDQGSSFNTVIELTDDSGNPLDLSAYTAQGQLRTSYASINSVSFNVNTSLGQIGLSLDSNTTTQLTRSRYVYDVFVTDTYGATTRIVEGVAYIDPTVTRAPYANTYYTLLLANVQQVFYTGDIVYQSNGSANVTAMVYESDNVMLQPIESSVGDPNVSVNSYANAAMIKIMNPSGPFTVTSNSTGLYTIISANTGANAYIVSITQTTTQNQE